MLLFFPEFFIYVINSLVWTFATDIGGRGFGGTATGILNCDDCCGGGRWGEEKIEFEFEYMTGCLLQPLLLGLNLGRR